MATAMAQTVRYHRRHKRAYKLFELIVQGTKAREGEMLLFPVAASSCKLSVPLRTGHGAF